ncbi:MAG: hypothetical protein AAF611_20775 [Bacteroidota bacterium]
MILEDFKKASGEVKFITIYNLLQTLLVTYVLIHTFPLGWFLGIFIVIVLVSTYHLLKGEKIAWTVLLIWYMLITFAIEVYTNALSIWLDLSYGFDFSLSLLLGNNKVSIDVIAFVALAVHYSARKHFKEKTVLDEIDEISGESTNID